MKQVQLATWYPPPSPCFRYANPSPLHSRHILTQLVEAEKALNCGLSHER